jgi:hypothetical protein
MPTIVQFPPPPAALYHAAGHAVVAWHFGMRIHSITINVRDPAAVCDGKDLAGACRLLLSEAFLREKAQVPVPYHSPMVGVRTSSGRSMILPPSASSNLNT